MLVSRKCPDSHSTFPAYSHGYLYRQATGQVRPLSRDKLKASQIRYSDLVHRTISLSAHDRRKISVFQIAWLINQPPQITWSRPYPASQVS